MINNSVKLIGRLGKDPELRTINSDLSVVEFSLATSYKKSGGEEVTNWHNCKAWRKTADLIAQICNKGDEVSIDGFINYRSYEGNKRRVTEIVVTSFLLHRSKQEKPADNFNAREIKNATREEDKAALDDQKDDLPF